MPDIEPIGQLNCLYIPEIHSNDQHLSADELYNIIIECASVPLFRRYFEDPSLRTPLNGFFTKWRIEISGWVKEGLELQMNTPNESPLLQQHFRKVVQRCEVLLGPK